MNGILAKLGVYDPDTQSWKEWQLPGENPLPYAVYVDEHDKVWISDFASNSFLSLIHARKI